jgi:hypothetical protein
MQITGLVDDREQKTNAGLEKSNSSCRPFNLTQRLGTAEPICIQVLCASYVFLGVVGIFFAATVGHLVSNVQLLSFERFAEIL